MTHTRLLAPLALVAAILAGCSDDSKTDAVQAVCDAESQVEAALENLEAFDPATDSTDDIRADVAALQSAVDDLASAQSDLDEKVTASAQQAWSDLSGQIQSLSGEPLAEARPEAQAEVQSAAREFRDSWSQAVADADC